MAELSPDQKKTLHVLAYMMLRMGRHESARRIWAALASLAPASRPDRHALTGLAAVAIEQGDGARALDCLRMVMEGTALSSRKAPLLLMKAQALQLEGRLVEAQAVCEEFIFITDNAQKGKDA